MVTQYAGDAGDAADCCRLLLLLVLQFMTRDSWCPCLLCSPWPIPAWQLATCNMDSPLTTLHTYAVTTRCSPRPACSSTFRASRCLAPSPQKEPRPRRKGADRLAASSWPCRHVHVHAHAHQPIIRRHLSRQPMPPTARPPGCFFCCRAHCNSSSIAAHLSSAPACLCRQNERMSRAGGLPNAS